VGIVYALVMLSVVLVGFSVWAFFWAVRNNQFDDLDTPAFSILEDDDPLEPGHPVSSSARTSGNGRLSARQRQAQAIDAPADKPSLKRRG